MLELISAWWIALQANPIVLTIFGSSIIGSVLYVKICLKWHSDSS